jgi:hypothetical protein
METHAVFIYAQTEVVVTLLRSRMMPLHPRWQRIEATCHSPRSVYKPVLAVLCFGAESFDVRRHPSSSGVHSSCTAEAGSSVACPVLVQLEVVSNFASCVRIHLSPTGMLLGLKNL